MNLQNNENIKVSIIVPIYNVEDYLEECIDSLVNQTYKNIEIILVDDGSTDGSSSICDKYAEQDKRIVLIRKTNGGLADARNAGISAISGSYATIVDADDWIDLETIEVLINKIHSSQNPIDCLIFSYVKERINSRRINHVFECDKDFDVEEGRNLVYRRLFGPIGKEMQHPEKLDYLSSCCMKLYKTEIIKKGRPFSNSYVGTGEDGLFNIYALDGVRFFSYIDRAFYHYRKNPNSITSKYKDNLQQQWTNLFREYRKKIELSSFGEEYTKGLVNRISLSIIGIGLNEISSPYSAFSQIKLLKKYLSSKMYVESLKSNDISFLPFKWKVLLICSKAKLSLFVYFILKLGDAKRNKYAN